MMGNVKESHQKLHFLYFCKSLWIPVRFTINQIGKNKLSHIILSAFLIISQYHFAVSVYNTHLTKINWSSAPQNNKKMLIKI